MPSGGEAHAFFSQTGQNPAFFRRFRAFLALTADSFSALFPPPEFRFRQPVVSKKANGGSAMNKNDLISAVADASGLSKGDATKAVEAVFDSVTGALAKGDEVRLVGFGTFSVAKRKASTGRNPRTGEPMSIKASAQPKFKAGKGLKDAVN
jgi:DNA-binding protein HU-beta